MAGTNNGGFSVGFTVQAQIDINSILQRADSVGTGNGTRKALRRALARLRSEARGVGDPLFHLRGMRMTVMNVTEPPLYLVYGVHDDTGVVVVRSVQLIR